jgi:hypothetical protein
MAMFAEAIAMLRGSMTMAVENTANLRGISIVFLLNANANQNYFSV